MRQYRFILASILLASVASAQSSLFAPASYSCRVPCDISFGATSSSNFIEHIVRYDATNITLCGMVLNVSTNVPFCDPLYYDFQDGAIQTSGPDLAAGAWGWNTGAVFAGTVNVTTSTTYRITNPAFTNGFLPVGYALVGTSSNPATITVGGKTITLDVGGALRFRAQGRPKGEAFGSKVDEWDTMRDKGKNPDAAALFGSMSKDELRASVERVSTISDEKIRAAVGDDKQLADILIARKKDLASKVGLATD